jgi:hypothetical protein
MIDLILKLLRSDEHLGYSEIIEIAKGKNKLPMSIKEKKQQVKREKAWLKRK